MNEVVSDDLKRVPKKIESLTVVNKPISTEPNTLCYKCKSLFYVHHMANMNSDFVLKCELHHENDNE